MEAIATKKLTITRETKKKELVNKKGEPYVLHEVMVNGPKGEFQAIMFCPPSYELPIGIEKQYSIAKGNNPGSYVIKEDKPAFAGKGYQRNPNIDIWRMALDAACVISTSKDVPSVMTVAKELVKQIKKEL